MTTPAALIPALQPELAPADSRVTIATTRDGSVTSISIRASRPSTSTERTMPRKRLRAESFSSTDAAAKPLDLGGGDDAAVGGVALDADLAVAVPAPQRVEADPERPGGLRGGEMFA